MIKIIFLLLIVFLLGSVAVNVYSQRGEICMSERPKYADRLIEPDFNLSLPRDLYDKFVTESTKIVIKTANKFIKTTNKFKCEAETIFRQSAVDVNEIILNAKAHSNEVIDRQYYYQINYKADNNILYLTKDGLSKVLVRFVIKNGKNTLLMEEGQSNKSMYKLEITPKTRGLSKNGDVPRFFVDAENNTKEYFKSLNVQMLGYQSLE